MSTETMVDEAELRELCADSLDVLPESLTDDAHFVDDLQVDSLVALELAVTLQRTYKVAISEEEIMTVQRFPDVYDLLKRKLAA